VHAVRCAPVAAAAVVAWAIVAWAASARAAPCGRPDLLETLPADGASGVPINARLSAHYAPSAEYLNEAVPLEHVGVGPEDAPATFDANEGLLTIAPAAPLVASDAYKISWPALRGLTTAALGKGADVQFTAGSISDMEAPRFSGMKALAWDVERSNDDCTDSPEDRYRFDFTLGDASDDGPRDLLTLVVFQTAGPAQSGGSPEPVLIERLPEPGGAVQVRRAIDDAVGRVCFAALVRDSVGQVSSGTPEVCATTVRPPFFYGCALACGPVRSWYPTLGFLGALAMVQWRRAPRRRGAT
jgi:hypothetical protein